MRSWIALLSFPWLCLAIPATLQAADAVTGAATYRERIALPPDVVFEATLEDISKADVKTEVIGSARVEHFGQVPVRFEIPYDGGKIQDSHRYSVRGRILIGGKLAWTTDRVYPVITGGHPTQVELLLRQVGARSKTASTNPTLEGTYWKLVRLGDTPLSAAANPRQTPHLVLSKHQQRVGGAGGCNRITGAYERDGSKLSFGKMAATMMACPEGMDTEQAFLQALGKVAGWKIEGRQLSLLGADGAALAQFEAQIP